MTVEVFPSDALDVNRSGGLSDEQLRGFRHLSRSNHRSALSSAAFLLAGAGLVMVSDASGTPVARVFSSAALVTAVFLIARVLRGSDALTRDLADGRVVSAEGPIGKRRAGGRTTVHFLDVGSQTFKVARATSTAAPDAGHVRLFFLPHSRKIVNLERLPNTPPSGDRSVRDLAHLAKTAYLSGTREERNEARASIAALRDGVGDAAQPQLPPRDRDPRALERAIVGTWTNALMRVTFTDRRAVTIHMMGGTREAHWSIDSSGRLCADLAGHAEAADAWIDDDRLTVVLDGRAMTFTRS